MCDKTASLERKGEIIRSIDIPFCKSFTVRETIESHIEFNRGELSAVIFKPVSSGKGFGIKLASPVIIEKTAAAYL
jgi:hypothetical protein